MAAKDNTSPLGIDKTSFGWVGKCGGCHTGGGPGEFDRDGNRYYDVATGQFGYELEGLTVDDMTYDGDYSFVSPSTGATMQAGWDVTGVAEPDCLYCHRTDRVVNDGTYMNWVWRSAPMRAFTGLKDSSGAAVESFAVAAVAGQGWLDRDTFTKSGSPPVASIVDVTYQPGLDDGSLLNVNEFLVFNGDRIAQDAPDEACWTCHTKADSKKRGREWFAADRDVHYAYFTGADADHADSTACIECHPGDMDHNFTSGKVWSVSALSDLDYVGFRDCAGCHVDEVTRHEEATAPTSDIHSDRHLATMACEFCHVPYKETKSQVMVDNSATGSQIGYWSTQFLSANPLDPTDPDKSRWYPGAKLKAGPDGVERLYPGKPLVAAWWGDWDDNGTPGDTSDDTITPIPLWQVRLVYAQNAPVVADDSGDGKLEVNTEAEMLSFIAAIKLGCVHSDYGVDTTIYPATNPALVKGGRLWYEDGAVISSFELHGSGMAAESLGYFSVSHNVIDPSGAWGAGPNGTERCGVCHWSLNGGQPTAVFDRPVLVDLADETGEAVYETIREMTGVSPF